ncbi:MAG: nuclear transport factor 2 family protein [Pseudomonadota bacterium]
MSRGLRGVLIVMASTMMAQGVAASTIDKLAITTIVESVAVLADQSNFESLERLFADPLTVDYSSLTGNEATVKSAQALMTEWAAMLPGFDRTRHSVSNIRVNIEQSTALATADVVAEHYIDDLFWRVEGEYRYELIKEGDTWSINAMTFIVRDEDGTREVFGPAGENAQRHPPSYIVRQQTKRVVRTFLHALEGKDMVTFNALWAEDAVQHMPYSPAGHPKRVTGKPALVELYKQWPATSGDAKFTRALVIHSMQDPQLVFAEFNGEVEIIPTGRLYQQTYGGLFHVVDGKIQLFREYYDPAPFAWAFGL